MFWKIGRAGKFRLNYGFFTISLLVLVLLLQGCSSQEGLSVEDQAPTFSLPSSTGSEVSLDDVIGEKPALLYFHMAVG